jgi:hypothetical protein
LPAARIQPAPTERHHNKIVCLFHDCATDRDILNLGSGRPRWTGETEVDRGLGNGVRNMYGKVWLVGAQGLNHRAHAKEA